MDFFVCEEKSCAAKRKRDKTLIELPKERVKRGRPRSHFVSYKTSWCLAYRVFCDKARKNGLCPEESPRHKLPYPFFDFDCEKYIKIPLSIVQSYPEELLSSVIDKSLKKLKQKMGAVTNLKIFLQEVSIERDIFIVSFKIVSSFNGHKRERQIEISGKY